MARQPYSYQRDRNVDEMRYRRRMRLQIVAGTGTVEFAPAVDSDAEGYVKWETFVPHKANTKISSEGLPVDKDENVDISNEEFDMLQRCMVALEEPLKAILDEPEIDEEHDGTRACAPSTSPVPDTAATTGHDLLESLWRLIKRVEGCKTCCGVRSETCDTCGFYVLSRTSRPIDM